MVAIGAWVPMTSPTSASTPALIKHLRLSAEHQAWLRTGLEYIEPESHYRAMLARGMDEAVKRRYGGTLHAAFEPFWRQLNVPAPFSWMPNEHLVLALLRLGQLCTPGRHPKDALRQVATFWAEEIVLKSALVQMTFQASNGSLADFLIVQYQSFENWQVFGRCKPRRRSARHYEIHYVEVASALNAPLSEALFQAFLKLFKVPGTVKAEIHDAMSFTIHMRLG